MNTAGVTRIESLSKDNYDTWKLHMEALLIKNDAWSYVSGELTKPETVVSDAASEAARKAWERGDAKAKSDIILAIGSSELKQIKGCITARDVWLKLEGTYQSRGPARKATLLKRLMLHRMEEGNDIREHINKFFDAVDKLQDMQVDIHPDVLATMLLYSLPSSFDNFRCAIEARDELPAPDTLRIKIIEESEARKDETHNTGVKAMFVSKNKGRMRGNKASTHEHRDRTQTNDKKFAKIRCYKCNKQGHKAINCHSKVDKEDKEQSAKNVEQVSLRADVALQASAIQPRQMWCLDSGATAHLCSTLNAFCEINNSRPGILNLASSNSTQTTAVGKVTVTANVYGENKLISLNKTLHVPDLRTNLMSVSKITDNGFKVVFTERNAKIIDKCGNIKLLADRIGDLYFARESYQGEFNTMSSCALSQTEKRSNFELWHRRLGHLNTTDLIKAQQHGVINGMKFVSNAKEFHCKICLEGKMTRTPFPKKSDRVSESLGIIHSDICGPMRVESIGRARYFIEFIDDHSRWSEVRFLRHKDEALQATKEFITFAEKQTGKNVKCFQSDNGSEFTGKDFENFLKSKGITRRLTIPYNPEQNGIAERRNRTLLDMARCLLAQAGLPPKFWAEAVNTANYIRNRCPSKSLDGLTPYQLWTGNVPDVSHFREFGCRVFCLNREPGRGKLDRRTKEGIFLGYATESKGFRVWLPEENKLVLSRDVKFVEDMKFDSEDPDLMQSSRSEEKDLAEEKGEKSEFVDIESSPSVAEQFDENDDDEEVPPEPLQPPSRGRGRPRILRTGERGRPRKVYTHIAEYAGHIEDEMALFSEIPIKQALTSPEADEWHDAMISEIKSILRKRTWKLIDRPKNSTTIGSRIVLRNKFNSDGTLHRRKARLVAQGFSQLPGLHFNETFAPVARQGSIRLVAALSAHLGMKMYHFDVETAYLNGDLYEEILMEPPKQLAEILRMISEDQNDKELASKANEMHRELQSGDKVCLLKKSLYGLRQAGRNWYTKLDGILKNFGATPSSNDPCLYYLGKGKDITLIVVYVDDILIATRDLTIINKFCEEVSNHLDIKNLGEVGFCLNVEFNVSHEKVTIHQRGYIDDILKRFGMSDCNPVSTPVDTCVKLTKKDKGSDEEETSFPYRELVGALTYLAVTTRPDISFAVSYLGQFNNCHGKEHWTAAKRVLRYLKGTRDLGLLYRRDSKPTQGFVDADWGSCPEDRRSYTGYLFKLSGSPISWDSRKQSTVALSSTEAEYMGLSECTKEAIYLRTFLEQLGFLSLSNITVFNDNLGALKLAQNPIYHSRSKHIDMRHHFIREALNNNLLKIGHVSTNDMPADMLTKGLPRPKHLRCVDTSGLCYIFKKQD